MLNMCFHVFFVLGDCFFFVYSGRCFRSPVLVCYNWLTYRSFIIYSKQFIATFPAAWSPQKVVNSRGIPSPKMAVTFRLRIYNKLPRYIDILFGWWQLKYFWNFHPENWGR